MRVCNAPVCLVVFPVRCRHADHLALDNERYHHVVEAHGVLEAEADVVSTEGDSLDMMGDALEFDMVEARTDAVVAPIPKQGQGAAT